MKAIKETIRICRQTIQKTNMVLVIALLLASITYAQPPKWAKAHGYKKNTTYVYFPERNFYYDTHTNVYFIWGGSRWVTYRTLPASYASFNFYGGRHIELNITSAHPYYYNHDHYRTYYVAPVKKQKKPKAVIEVRTAPVIVIQTGPGYHKGYGGHGHGHGGHGHGGHGKGHGGGHGKGHGGGKQH